MDARRARRARRPKRGWARSGSDETAVEGSEGKGIPRCSFMYIVGFSMMLMVGLTLWNLAFVQHGLPMPLSFEAHHAAPKLAGASRADPEESQEQGDGSDQLGAMDDGEDSPGRGSFSSLAGPRKKAASSAGAAKKGDQRFLQSRQQQQQQQKQQQRRQQLQQQQQQDGRNSYSVKTDAGLAASRVASQPSTKKTARVPPRSTSSEGGVLMVPGTGWLSVDAVVDAPEITFGTWIFLTPVREPEPPASSRSIKTIAATKTSGCKVGEESSGWSFFVHEWGTNNRQLRLSWTDDESACHELYSQTVTVPWDAWVSVGFSLSAKQNRATIFLNNEAVVDTAIGPGIYVVNGQTRPLETAPISNRHISTEAERRFYIGAHAPQKADPSFQASHVFYGFLGDIRMVKQAFEAWADALEVIRRPTPDLGKAPFLKQAKVFGFQWSPQGPLEGSMHRFTGSTLTASSVGGGQEVSVVMFEASPDISQVLGQGKAEPIGPAIPGPRLKATELRETFPEEWLERWGAKELERSQNQAYVWADEVRDAMRHSWKGYKSQGWGRDEIRPDTGKAKDWCKMAILMLDSLSTLWLMGLKKEFAEAVEWIDREKMPTPGKHGMHSFFEITIRGLAGLLSGYALSGEKPLLRTAVRLADNMLKAFNTRSGIPKSAIDVGTGESEWHKWSSQAIISEVATNQMELRYLSQATGDAKYKLATDKAFNAVMDSSDKGLIPVFLTRDSANPKTSGNRISMGAMGDSYYEYLLKQWIQSGRKEDRLKNKWKQVMQDMQDQLVRKTVGGITYIADIEGGRRNRMDHLSCFVGGMAILGARTLPAAEVDTRWEPLAGSITETCHKMYNLTPSGLSSEDYLFKDAQAPPPRRGRNAKEPAADMSVFPGAPSNKLRPEAIESMYYMWYYTGDHKYRLMAYEIFTAFQRHARAAYGYSGIHDVRQERPRHTDTQESFWLAETLKYLYLIFSPRSTLNLDKWVFNTEAHPLPVWS